MINIGKDIFIPDSNFCYTSFLMKAYAKFNLTYINKDFFSLFAL